MPAQLTKFVLKCTFFTGLWDLGESAAMILSKYALTKVENATKMNLKCLYIKLCRWIVNYVLDCRGTRNTANTHDFVIAVE